MSEDRTPRDTPEQIQHAYEAYTRMVLQAAVNYVDGDPRCDRIWVYTNLGHQAIETSVFFRFDDKFVDGYDLAKLDDSRDYDPDQLVQDCAQHEDLELVRALRQGAEFPERIITVHDPRTGELDSQWDYDGVLTGEKGDSYGIARDRWIVSMGGEPIFG